MKCLRQRFFGILKFIVTFYIITYIIIHNLCPLGILLLESLFFLLLHGSSSATTMASSRSASLGWLVGLVILLLAGIRGTIGRIRPRTWVLGLVEDDRRQGMGDGGWRRGGCCCWNPGNDRKNPAVVGVPQARPLPEPGMEEDAEMKLLLLESAQDGGERRDEAAEIQKV